VLRGEINGILEADFGGGDAENGMQNIVGEVKVLNLGNNVRHGGAFEVVHC